MDDILDLSSLFSIRSAARAWDLPVFPGAPGLLKLTQGHDTASSFGHKNSDLHSSKNSYLGYASVQNISTLAIFAPVS